ncbi:uncharacterized protein LOC106179954 isoform X1 [Lingula anatina]|uniref:Uncharacterized protein LOC106179954 isoform X1 n=2 Tax=Lingula anatina TaxID=7574 RepID=A0A1S3K9W6_LINAN|nr:uncharacterized protein LOC106179954 isoform X1 [Lingula anatina]|eukprot:XP_013419239.1 uncharacterized protein LOC106179954 isoform X1 [Lingula anatina]
MSEMGKRQRKVTETKRKDAISQIPCVTAVHIETNIVQEQSTKSIKSIKTHAANHSDDQKMDAIVTSPSSNPAKRTRSKTLKQIVRSPCIQSPPASLRFVKSSTPKDSDGSLIELLSPRQNSLFTMSTPIRHPKKCKLQDSFVFTPKLKDDILLSQAESREVVWDCNSPDAIKRFNQMCLQKLPAENRENEIKDLVNDLVDGAKVVPSCSSTLMGIWNLEDTEESRPFTRQMKKKGRGKLKSTKPNVLSKDLMEKLADIIKLQDETTEHGKNSKSLKEELTQVREVGESNNTTSTQPLSYVFDKGSVLPSSPSTMAALSQIVSQLSQTERESILEQQRNGTLFQRHLSEEQDDVVENGIAPLDDGWESDDLFNDESLIKATQEMFDDFPLAHASKTVKRKSGNIADLLYIPVKKSGRATFSLDSGPPNVLNNNVCYKNVLDCIPSAAKSHTNFTPQHMLDSVQQKKCQSNWTSNVKNSTGDQSQQLSTLKSASCSSKDPCSNGDKEHIKLGKKFNFKGKIQSTELQRSKMAQTDFSSTNSNKHNTKSNTQMNPSKKYGSSLQPKCELKIQTNRKENYSSTGPVPNINVVDKSDVGLGSKQPTVISDEHKVLKSGDWNDNSLTDDLLFQLAEPDEVLDRTTPHKPVKAKIFKPQTCLADTNAKSNRKLCTNRMPKEVYISNQNGSQVQFDKVQASAQTSGNTVAGAEECAHASSDSLLDDDDDALSEPQILAILDHMESQATQQTSQSRCTAAEIERKRQAALKKKQEKLRASQTSKVTKKETVPQKREKTLFCRGNRRS